MDQIDDINEHLIKQDERMKEQSARNLWNKLQSLLMSIPYVSIDTKRNIYQQMLSANNAQRQEIIKKNFGDLALQRFIPILRQLELIET